MHSCQHSLRHPQHVHHCTAVPLVHSAALVHPPRCSLTHLRSVTAPACSSTSSSPNLDVQQHSRAVCCRAYKADAQLQQPTAANSNCTDRGVQFWEWRGCCSRRTHKIAYVTHGSGPIPVVLIHGMGACHEHWTKLLSELDTSRYTAYALDLLGFGASDKPLPAALIGEGKALEGGQQQQQQQGQQQGGHLYSFDTWSSQIRDFVNQVVCAPAVLVGNSAGALAALQAAVAAPDMTRGLMLLDCSMRHMHEANQPPLLHPFIAAFQWLLLRTPVGRMLVQGVLNQPDALKSILQGAYGDPSCLSPELLASWSRHLRDPTSCEVLLDVMTNSSGPLPQDLLPLNTVPTVILWGASDPWEPVARAKEVFEGWSADFVELPGVGHFPQDEVPALVAAMLDSFVEECALDTEGDSLAAAAAAAAAAAGRCRPGPDGQTVEGFTLRGLMAAAEMDPKV